eukprot:1909764-Alexandrium_andersonii.AAC.1
MPGVAIPAAFEDVTQVRLSKDMAAWAADLSGGGSTSDDGSFCPALDLQALLGEPSARMGRDGEAP